MGRPPSDVGDYVEWQGRLERFRVSELDLNLFCLREGVSRSTFYRWKNRLEEGVPESIELPATSPNEAESDESVFVPLSLKATAVEIELPNGGLLRLPAGVGRDLLVAIVRVAGSLRPWRATHPESVFTHRLEESRNKAAAQKDRRRRRRATAK